MRCRNILVAEWLVLLTLDHKVPGSNPARDGIQLMTVWPLHCTEPSYIIIRARTSHWYIDKSRSGSPRYPIDTDLSNVLIFQSESSSLDQSCKLVCVTYKTSPWKCYNTKCYFIGLADQNSAITEVARHLPLICMNKIGEITVWRKTEFPISHSVK